MLMAIILGIAALMCFFIAGAIVYLLLSERNFHKKLKDEGMYD